MTRSLASQLDQWLAGDPGAEAAAALLAAADADVGADRATRLRFLDQSRRPAFLGALPDAAAREAWTRTAFAQIDATGCTLETLLEQRVAEHPDRPWLHDADPERGGAWSFAETRRRARACAAALLHDNPSPRVALFTPNCPQGALADLACLLHGIVVTPVAPATDAETLAWILEAMAVDTLVSGGADQHRLADEAVRLLGRPVRRFVLDAEPCEGAPIGLDEAGRGFSPAEVDAALARQPRLELDAVCTVMFTSGSTGRPKGVEFSLRNLVSKRFARAAALPAVGRDEVLLCYLPLFHTFGRYLELLGTLFWGGTYVFAGNTSRETLLRLVPRIRPTGMIGIPLRWTQLYEAALARAGDADEPLRRSDLDAVLGDRLRWGLSAAGYLDPRVFRFFHRHGMELCSGFGMTEATGGITMTPPGGYRDGSVGRPLPGIDVRLTDEGEMEIAGAYVGSYLDDAYAPGDGHWLATGDIFERDADGHLRIVDRIKDIYKNARGQTIAPRRVEQCYIGVPGIARVFLVGDHRNDNVLLIVPDAADPVLQGDPQGEAARDYFNRIVNAANADLHAFERVVDFAVLDRDFTAATGELTPKGSLRRKAIEANFAAVIDDLYRSEALELKAGGLRVRVPRWLLRDLGVLEEDVTADGDRLHVSGRAATLGLGRPEPGLIRVGDLLYPYQGDRIDLGLFSRQPLLWLGNDELVRFCPVKDGWDTAIDPFTPHIYLPRPEGRTDVPADPLQRIEGVDPRLHRLHALCAETFAVDGVRALRAINSLEQALDLADHRTSELLRRRIEALSRHPAMPVRCRAYSILLEHQAAPDYRYVRPKFLESGLPFLDAETIATISSHGLEERRLEAFRRRLLAYREYLAWPVDAAMRQQFDYIFELLEALVREQPSYYATVRDELAGWVLLREDPAVGSLAEAHLNALSTWYETWLGTTIPYVGEAPWRDRIVFQDGLSPAEIQRLKAVMIGTSFLQQSVRLTADGAVLDIRDVPPDGIWVGRTAVRHQQRIYRVCVNTNDGKHYDLLLVAWDEDLLASDRRALLQTIYWILHLSGHVDGRPILPRFGCYRPDMGVLSLAYVNDLTVWERIREYGSDRQSAPGEERQTNWRRLFVTAMATFFRGWDVSGGILVPGMITPMNVAVPEPDFRDGAQILSLAGWQPYVDTLSLVRPMLRNFFKQTTLSYPWTRGALKLTWICDACVEALGLERALEFLDRLRTDLADQPLGGYRGRLASELPAHLAKLRTEYYVSCGLHGAVDRYRRWENTHTNATPAAREQAIVEMIDLYGLDHQPDLARYQLFARTWFRRAEEPVRQAFARLLDVMFRQPRRSPLDTVELSELHGLLADPDDRHVFHRMAFPHTRMVQETELIPVGGGAARHVVLRTTITDKTGAQYAVREPLEAAELGQLYRLFFESGYYRTISESDRFLVALDGQERIVGGVSWTEVNPTIVHLNGIVVGGPLLGRGISSALIEDLSTRLANLGYHAVKTLFVLRPFFERHGFVPDRRWGGLVRSLDDD